MEGIIKNQNDRLKMTTNYEQDMEQLRQLIDEGKMPPRTSGYGGIDVFSAGCESPGDIMEDIIEQIHVMNGKILLREPFRVTWRVNTGHAVDTVFTAWIRSHDLNQFFVYIDLVGGISRNYIQLILPMIQALFKNGTFEMNIQFDETKWRKNAIKRIVSILKRDIEFLEEEM